MTVVSLKANTVHEPFEHIPCDHDSAICPHLHQIPGIPAVDNNAPSLSFVTEIVTQLKFLSYMLGALN